MFKAVSRTLLTHFFTALDALLYQVYESHRLLHCLSHGGTYSQLHQVWHMVWEDVHDADDALDGHQFDFIADFHEGWLLNQCDEFLTESLLRKLMQTRFRGHC